MLPELIATLRRELAQEWRSWRLYGLPRCRAHDFSNGETCGRLMWPWQAWRGNGEEPRHAACQDREDVTFENMERAEEEAEWL